MDWNTILFAARWVMVALFYFALLVLLAGVYREASSRMSQSPAEDSVVYGRLRVLHPGSDPRAPSGTIFHLKPVTRLGANQHNDIILGDQYVSGHHILLRWDGTTWWLEDLNSKNGTLVNRQPVQPSRPHPIHAGSVISAGDMVLELIE